MALIGRNSQSGAGDFIDNATPDTLITNSQGADKILRIEKLLITNVDAAAAVTLNLYHVPSGGAISGDDYLIVHDLSINPSDGTFGTEDIREVAGLILDNGDTLRALAGTASKLKFNISYWEED